MLAVQQTACCEPARAAVVGVWQCGEILCSVEILVLLASAVVNTVNTVNTNPVARVRGGG